MRFRRVSCIAEVTSGHSQSLERRYSIDHYDFLLVYGAPLIFDVRAAS